MGTSAYQIEPLPPLEARRRPDGNGSYIWNVNGIEPNLYCESELKEAIVTGMVTIFIVESKKDVESLKKLGLSATTNGGGSAGKWRDSYSAAFHGLNIVIIAYKDIPGRKHAMQAASSFYGKVASLKLLELPDRDGHQVKDASDWLAAGGTRGELECLVKEAKLWTPQVSQTSEGIKVVCLSDIEPEAVTWLWRPYIPQGKLTLLEGDPGVGKSWVSLAIATAVSTGKGLPGTEPGQPHRALICSAEDGLGDTLRPRLDDMGADVSNIHAIKGSLTFDSKGMELLQSYITSIQPLLLIIDPLVAYLGAEVDLHRANEVRAVTCQLAAIAERYSIAILAVRHLTKGGMSKAIYRGLGSIDITAACRSVLLAGGDAENPQSRALVHIKSNLAPMGKAIGYELREGVFYWTGESSLTAAQILAADNGAGPSELDEAMTFLKGELTVGEVPAQHIYRVAQDTGFAKRTLDRAKAKLQAKSKKIDSAWFWYLPESTLPTLPIQNLGNLEVIEAKKEVVPEGLGNVDYKNTLDYPIHSCPACGAKYWWQRDDEEWLCKQCHPKPGGGN